VRLIHTPPEGERREYVFKPNETLSPDAEAIELVGGEAWETWDEYVRLFNRGHRRALRAALWIARRRAGEDRLRFADLVLRADEVHIDYDDDELKVMREKIRSDTDLADDVRAALLQSLGGDGSADVEEVAAPKARRSGSRRKPADTPRGGGSTAG
jgi:hypothetical protein